MSSLRPVYVAASLILAGGVAALLVAGSGAAASPTVFVAANGSDSNACSSSAPCRSLQRAYNVASPGDIVQVAAGTYPQQTIAKAARSPAVTFVPAGTVVFGCATGDGQSCLDIYASGVHFDGGPGKDFETAWFTAGGFRYQGRIDTERGATDIVFTNMDVGAVAQGASNSQVTHNDLGPSVDPLNNRQADGDGDVWQFNVIHDYEIHNGGHMECLTWDDGTNVTMSDNAWSNCAVFAIFAKPTENISGRVERNTFAQNGGTNDDLKISLGSGADHCYVNVFGNSFSNGTYYDCPGVTFNDPGPQPPPTTTTVPTTTAATTTAPTTTTAPSCARPSLTSSAATDTSHTLSWPKVPGATAYQLKNGAKASTAGSGATSAKFGSLPYGDTVLSVQAVCGGAVSQAASLISTEQRKVR